jgi:hypothetical protein
MTDANEAYKPSPQALARAAAAREKMSSKAQKKWAEKTGVTPTMSAKQASKRPETNAGPKDIAAPEKKTDNKDRLQTIAQAARKKLINKSTDMKPSSERVRAAAANIKQFGGERMGGNLGSAGGVISHIRQYGSIKGGRLGEGADATTKVDKWTPAPKLPIKQKKAPGAATLAKEEVEQVDEGAGYGIGSVVKLHKPIDGHEYGHVMGITGSKVTHGPTGRGSPMPAGKATSIHLQLKKTPNYTADYGGKVEVPLSAIHSKIREEVEQVNELKKSTLASYIKKAAIQRTHAASQAGVEFGIGVGSDAYKSDSKYIAKQNQKVGKRTLGMDKAVNKLAKEEVETEEVTYIEERLSKNDPPSQWIQDFVKSDNPKFAGKSKKDRINMALGAFYSKKRQK